MVSNSLTQTRGNKPQTFSQYLRGDNMQTSLLKTLGSEKAKEKFCSSIISAVTANPDLQTCDFSTIVAAGLLANALDLSLSPSLGLAYIVPFKDKKNDRTIATFVLGYRGYIQLAIRSGYYRKLNVIEIKEGELISYDRLTEDVELRFIEDDAEREKTPTIGYFAMFEHINGFRKTLYWSKKKMLAHADRYSPAFSLNGTKGKYAKASYAEFEAGKVADADLWKYSSFWYKDFDGMAKKTMIRQLISKWGIMSIEMQRAFDADSEQMQESENAASFVQPIDEEADFFADSTSVSEPNVAAEAGETK